MEWNQPFSARFKKRKERGATARSQDHYCLCRFGRKKFGATYKKEETVDIKEKSLKEWSIFFLPKEQGKDKRILLFKKIRGTSRSAICGLEALIPISPWQSFYGLQTSLYFWRLGGIMERSV